MAINQDQGNSSCIYTGWWVWDVIITTHSARGYHWKSYHNKSMNTMTLLLPEEALKYPACADLGEGLEKPRKLYYSV